MNQCDGCRRGLPVVNGVHRGPGGFWSGDIQGCTKDRYLADGTILENDALSDTQPVPAVPSTLTGLPSKE